MILEAFFLKRQNCQAPLPNSLLQPPTPHPHSRPKTALTTTVRPLWHFTMVSETNKRHVFMHQIKKELQAMVCTSLWKERATFILGTSTLFIQTSVICVGQQWVQVGQNCSFMEHRCCWSYLIQFSVKRVNSDWDHVTFSILVPLLIVDFQKPLAFKERICCSSS